MDQIWPYVIALLPSIGVCYLFYLIIKNILASDRNERIAQARWEKQRQSADSNYPEGRPTP